MLLNVKYVLSVSNPGPYLKTCHVKNDILVSEQDMLKP